MPATVVAPNKPRTTMQSMPAVRPAAGTQAGPAARPAGQATPSAKPPPLPARANKDPSERTLLGVAPAPPVASAASSSASATAKAPPVPTSPTLPSARAAIPPEPTTGVERTIVSPPPVIASTGNTPLPAALPQADDEAIAGRLTELAKAALLGGDAGALERWSEGLRATGEHERFAERMEAMARLWRGQVGDALRVLKRARDLADNGNRSQASLALGVALAAAGRPEEALLEGLDALARAREKRDEKGSSACLAFLSKLFQSQRRDEDADLLRSASRRS
jgi:hypothetical protein